MTKVLLYSGGMDSWIIDKLWKPEVKLYVDMNTKYSPEEIKRLSKEVIVERLDLGKWERSDAIIPLRNLFLVMIASYYGDDVCLGATAGDRPHDKTEPFAEKISDLLTYLYMPQKWNNGKGRNISVHLTFKNLSKGQLLSRFIEDGGNPLEAWENSFSCYSPINNKHCFFCKACYRRVVAFYHAMKDLTSCKFENLLSTKQLKKLYEYLYMKNLNELEDALVGKTGRGAEENEHVEFYKYLSAIFERK